MQKAWSTPVRGSIIAAYSDMMPLIDAAAGLQARIERGDMSEARITSFLFTYALANGRLVPADPLFCPHSHLQAKQLGAARRERQFDPVPFAGSIERTRAGRDDRYF